jgi:hypothetical protein
VQLTHNAVRATYHGRSVTATVGFSAGAIVVGLPGLASLRVPVPKIPLMPCQPSASVLDDRVVLTCSFNRIPPEMIGLANRLTGQ